MNTSTLPPFHISLTADFYQADGTTRYDNIGLDTFSGHDHIVLSRFPEHRPEIASEQVQNAHAVLVLTPTVTAASLVNSENLLMISRFGVGYDAVDVEACTRNHVLVTNTPGAVDRQSLKPRSAGCLR